MRTSSFGLSEKFHFRIRTRDGLVLDNLRVVAPDLSEAERRLRQIYRGCEILSSQTAATVSAFDRPQVSEEISFEAIAKKLS